MTTTSVQDYTVFGVYENDPNRRFSLTVKAASPEEAEARAAERMLTSIVVAAVVPGAVIAEHSGPADVSPILGRGYETAVAKVRVEYFKVRLPFFCPDCKADLRRENTIQQWDYRDQYWYGRLPRGEYHAVAEHVGVNLNHDVGPRQPPAHTTPILCVLIRCNACCHELWNGFHEATGGL